MGMTEREREGGGGGSGATRDELKNELAGRSTLNQRHRCAVDLPSSWRLTSTRTHSLPRTPVFRGFTSRQLGSSRLTLGPPVDTALMTSHGHQCQGANLSANHVDSREVNPRNTGVLGSECVLVDVNIAKTKVSQHICVFDSMWTFQPVRFWARLSWPHSPPPPLSLSLSLSFPFLTKPFGKRQTF